MSNLTDALIAAKLMGNGGGGGGGGLPEITTESETILEKQTLEFEDWGGTVYGSSVTGMPMPVVGEHYLVTYDGVEYNLVAFHPSTEDPDEVLIGNGNIWQSDQPDTGEPFVIDYNHDTNPDSGESMSFWDIMTSSTSATHEVGASRLTQVPADGAALSVKDGEWKASGHVLPAAAQWSIIVNPTEFSFSEVQPGIHVGGGSVIGWEVNVGDVLRLTWDGTPYEITLFDFNGSLVGGNTSIVGAGTDTGEPFFMSFEGDGHYQFITNETGASHIISFDQWEALPDGTTMQVVDGEWVAVEDSTKPLLITLNENDEIDITYAQWRNAVENASNIVIYDQSRQDYYPVLHPNNFDPPFITGMNIEWDSNGPQINAYALNIYTNSSEGSDDEIISVDSVERSNQLIISISNAQ